MRKRVLIGDQVPYFSCPSSNRKNFSFSTAAGRYIVLCFYGSTSIAKNKGVIDFISGNARRFFDDKNVAFFGVTVDKEDRTSRRVKQKLPGIRFFWDFDYAVSLQYGAMQEDAIKENGMVTYRSFTLILDPNMRVIADIPLDDLERHNTSLVEILDKLLPIDQYAGVPMIAPVLIVPNVLETALCRELIELYETHGGRDSGTMVEKDGYTIGKIDHSFKRRSDYLVDDAALKTKIRRRIIRRIAPQIKKAFQFEVSAVERYIVACYDGKNSGFFRPHRDNTTKGTAHRKFACTINLNAEDYEGGELRFPEFGPRTYKAPTGGAIIFSCSLLHEATPVIGGTRYATLPFLYDECGAVVRRKNQAFLSDAEAVVIEHSAGKTQTH